MYLVSGRDEISRAFVAAPKTCGLRQSVCLVNFDQSRYLSHHLLVFLLGFLMKRAHQKLNVLRCCSLGAHDDRSEPFFSLHPMSSAVRCLTFVSSRVNFSDFGISDSHPANKCLAIVGMSIVLFFPLPSVQISKQLRSARQGRTSGYELQVVTIHQQLRGASGASPRECFEYFAAALYGFVAVPSRGH